MLKLRSTLVPIVNFSAMTQQWLLIGSFMLINTMPQLLLISAIVFGVTALFSFIPVSPLTMTQLMETDSQGPYR